MMRRLMKGWEIYGSTGLSSCPWRFKQVFLSYSSGVPPFHTSFYTQNQLGRHLFSLPLRIIKICTTYHAKNTPSKFEVWTDLVPLYIRIQGKSNRKFSNPSTNLQEIICEQLPYLLHRLSQCTTNNKLHFPFILSDFRFPMSSTWTSFYILTTKKLLI